MMVNLRALLVFLLFCLPLALLGQKAQHFRIGEKLEYRLHYGFITAGYAEVEVGERELEQSGKDCYLVTVKGRTAAVFDKTMFSVKDEWGSYIDKKTLNPLRFYRFIQENEYRKNEIYVFDHGKKQATVLNLNNDTKEVETIEYYEVPYGVQDLVSGFFWLREISLEGVEEGDILTFPAFFEKENLDFRMEYVGTDKIRTDFGKKECYVFKPFLAPNKIFSGEQPVTLYVSKDKNRLPLLIAADMWLGAIEVELIEAEGLIEPYD